MPTLTPEQVFTLHGKTPKLSILIGDDPFLTFWLEKMLSVYCAGNNPPNPRKIYFEGDWPGLLHQLTLRDMFHQPSCYRVGCSKPSLFKDHDCEKLAQTALKGSIPTLIVFEKLTPAQQKSAWFKQLTAQACILHAKPMTAAKTSTWFAKLVQHYQLSISPSVQKSLCQLAEFTPTCLEQCLVQLYLQAPSGSIGLDLAQSFMMTTPSQSPAYQAVDLILQGDIGTLTQKFPPQDTPIDQVQAMYWLLVKRLRQLLLIRERAQIERTPLPKLFQEARIWPSQQAAAQRCLRIPGKKIYPLYSKLCSLEMALKGQTNLPFSGYFFHLATLLCHACAQPSQTTSPR